jgi:anti-sigma-K factor RskA
MVFRNMRRNDPTTEQYQLWIFDKDRDERYPVDGGVFDITESGECIVPIHAAVQVNEAALFAVTIERPGGVVVSDRSRLPLLAQPKPAG